MKTNVGILRQQTALCNADTPAIIVTDDEDLKKLLQGRQIRIVEVYPATTDGQGQFNSTFKIKVAIERPFFDSP